MPFCKSNDLPTKRLNGLSLVEVSIAIAILAVILVSLSSVFTQGYRFLRKTRMSHLACFLAQEKMEQFLHNSTFDYLGSINGSQNLAAPYQDFNGTVNVTYPATGAGSNATVDSYLARINVTVSWQGQKGVQNLTLTSLVSNLAH